MLALKELRIINREPSKQCLLDLPDELLDEVVHFLYTDNGRFTRDLIPTSATCSRLRKATVPILFRNLHIRITRKGVDKRTFNILLNLDLAPHTFACHVRHMKQDDSPRAGDHGCEGLEISNDLVMAVVKRGLGALVNLTRLSLGCPDSILLSLLPKALLGRPLKLILEACPCAPHSARGETPALLLCESPIEHQFAISTSSAWKPSPLALDPWIKHHPERTLALSWRHMRMITPGDSLSHNPPLMTFLSLQELHLIQNSASEIMPDILGDVLLNLAHLRRLSLVGAGLCSAALRVVSQLENLESLRLNSPLDRIFHAHLRNHEFEGLPYLHLPRLQSLEIRYISRYLSIEHVVPTKITHLRIEYHNRNERLTPYDLRWIARHAPNIDCLEIDTGALANLWHPTAVAGVDVDMEVYSMFGALSSFKNLRTLRLFPSYWQSLAGNLHFVQPVADDQAIRIFRHIRLQCKKLRLLIISNSSLDYRSRNEVFSRVRSEPMKWIVRPSGLKTLLTTHEANKNYHLEQVWEGDRRLTMTTVRHHGRRLHFDELEDWMLPTFEFPFDEPQTCYTENGPHYGIATVPVDV